MWRIKICSSESLVPPLQLAVLRGATIYVLKSNFT
jgi:hypothetical protein